MNVVKRIFFIALMIWMLWIIKSYAETATINTEGARIRREPNTSSDVLTIAYSGEKVEIIEKSGEWYKVRYGESIGYIREDLMSLNVEKTEKSPSDQEIETSQDVQEEQVEPEQEVSQENLDEQENHTEVQDTVFQEVERQIISDTDIRIIPSLSASSVDTLKEKTKVTVIQVINSWSCIKNEDKTGWMPSCFLTDVEVNESNEKQQTKIGYVNVSEAIIRKGPSTSAEIITGLGKDKPVEIVTEEGDWYKIIFNGEEAYVAKRLISDEITTTSRSMQKPREVLEEKTETIVEQKVENVQEPNIIEEKLATVEPNEEVVVTSSKGEELVKLAKQYLGCSYVYGGSGPKNFDCSGFTQYIYKQFGISLAHSAVTQANSGTYVAKSDLQLGDLVIFRDWDNNTIGHCGIYIGGGSFIHAANSTRGVVTDTLNSGYYYERYVSGRRLF